MGLDAVCLEAMAHELRGVLLGGKVDKIFQPGPNEAVFAMRGNRENVRLLLSAEPGSARAQLTEANRENPAAPPVFCMLLRKHLTAARLLDIVQPDGERILRFVFSHVNELGDAETRNVILEAMGTQTNLILTDGEDRVIACTRRVEGDLTSGKRQVMPGLFYQPPEPRPGVPPLLARELEFRGKDREEGLLALRSQVSSGEYAPTMLLREGKVFDFSFLPILQYGPEVELVPFSTFGEMLDEYYARKGAAARVSPQAAELSRSVKSLMDRTRRKLENQRRELAQAKDREALRVKGDLLMSNLHLLHKGERAAALENYYDPEGGVVEITLDPLLTPQQNAAKYYKDYAKARTAEEVLTGQIAKGEEDLQYLESVLESVALSEGERDWNEIRAELEDTGWLRRKRNGKKTMKTQVKPLEFVTSGGFRVSVGKNNTQNDVLTCKRAGRDDWWFHAQKSHGAHVILWTEGREPDDESLTEAAGLAAWYSQARESERAAVDYTPVKYVKKPNGAKPGMVVYTTYQTAWVKPIQKP